MLLFSCTSIMMVTAITSYDNYIFSRSWIPSFCKFNHQGICNNNSQFNKFTIHGLWPTFSNDSWPQYCNQIPIDSLRFKTIIPEMIREWSDNNQTADKLWNHEWTKHGTCSLGNHYISNSNDYFLAGLWVNRRLNAEYEMMVNNIIASNTSSYLKSRLQKVFNSGLVCKQDQGKYLLTEVRNEISLNFSTTC